MLLLNPPRLSSLLCATIAVFVLALIANPVGRAFAHEPSSLDIIVAKALPTGIVDLAASIKKGDTQIDVRIKNSDPELDALVRFPVCGEDSISHGMLVTDLDAAISGVGGDPVPVIDVTRWTACVYTKSTVPGVFLVRRGLSITVRFAIDFRALGSQHVRIIGDVYGLQTQAPEPLGTLAASIRAARTLEAPVIDQFLRASAISARLPLSVFYSVSGSSSMGTAFQLSSYAGLYLQNQDSLPEGGMPVFDYVDGAVAVDLDDYRTFKRVLPKDETYDPQHDSLYRIPVDTGGPSGSEIMCVAPTENDCRVRGDCPGTIGGITHGGGLQSAQSAGSRGGTSSTYTITGRFSSKWTDHTLHPAWGWRAVAWWNNGGAWTELASEWVQWDGSYELLINRAGYSGQNLRVQYRAHNRYYEPMDEDDNLFRWRGPDRTNIALNHDDGHWYADTDGTDTNGLGEVYFRGYQLWSKLYWTAEIDPLRANPIKIYYPNTEYDCGSGSGVPWSCANTAGTVWLIPVHGLTLDVVQHEMGHQVNNEFHDNKRPAGAGGAHSLTVCYNQGLALREGYADFMPHWIQADRTTDPGSTISSYPIEAPTAGYCKTPGNNNEVWVSSTFWDLHDTRSDTNDILWYIHPGAVHKLYLANGPANDGDPLGMDEFQAIYNSNCSAGHSGFIDAIFEQNDTD